MQAGSPSWPIHLGCPIWSCDKWADQVYPPRTPRREWLRWYSRTFNTVEGNSTFYATPTVETTRRWAEQTEPGFKFVLKLPRVISHDQQLVGSDAELSAFLGAIEPLAEADRLGPTFLQLSPHFGPDQLKVLAHFLHLLPRDLAWAVELRHPGWFDSSDNEHRLNDLLTRHHVDKVLFDSRALFQSPPDDEIETESQRRKPQTPVRQTITGKHPVLRLVGRNTLPMADRFVDQWVPIVGRWINDGLQPFIFAHAPDDALAPTFARRFADRFAQGNPDHRFNVPWPPKPASQLSLLDQPEDEA